MRIKINLSKNKTNVPIQNQSLLNSWIHKVLGENNKWHDKKSNYSISSLRGGKMNDDKQTLNFPKGGFITVSSLDDELITTFLLGVMKNPDFGFGMGFVGVDYIKENFHDGWNYFATLSPFIVKEYNDGKYKFLTLKDENFEEKLKEYLKKKLIPYDLDLTDFNVKIGDNKSNKVKQILVKNVINHANQCQVNIFCNKKVAETLYNIGIGQSTGSGFGTIYKTENHKTYRNQD
jgi:CRISPR-associated endoribonuclease Cas6